MKWKGRKQSSNMQDRRGMSGGGMLMGGGVIGVIVLLVQMFTGADLSQILPGDMHSRAPVASRWSLAQRKRRWASLCRWYWPIPRRYGIRYLLKTICSMRTYAGTVQPGSADRLRRCEFGFRTLLLPGRQNRVYGSGFLR